MKVFHQKSFWLEKLKGTVETTWFNLVEMYIWMSLMYFKKPPLLFIHLRINITRTHAKGHPVDNSWNIDS